MTNEDQRLWLIQRLLAEEPAFRRYAIPKDPQEQKRLLRALMNVRPPRPLTEEFFAVQDAYLSQENRVGRVLTDAAALPPCKLDARVSLWQGDITALRADAIVNAANSALLGCFSPCHGCIDNIIHTRAGIQLRLKCHALMTAQGCDEPTGQAKITPGYNLPCRYVIHTVGPIVEGELTQEHERMLSSCYRSCLELADQYQLETIAFCCVSTGVFMFPNQRAAEIAVKTVRDYYAETGSQIKTIFNVFKDIDYTIYDQLLNPS